MFKPRIGWCITAGVNGAAALLCAFHDLWILLSLATTMFLVSVIFAAHPKP